MYDVHPLPLEANATWADINDAGRVVGTDNEMIFTNVPPYYVYGRGVFYDLYNPTGVQHLAMIQFDIQNWHGSRAYAVSADGTIVGASRGSDNMDKPVRLDRGSVDVLADFGGAHAAIGIGRNDSRILVMGASTGYILNTNNGTAYKICDLAENGMFGSAAMNAVGEAVVVDQENGTEKNVYFCEVPGSSLIQTLIPDLSATGSDVNIRAMNTGEVIVGERLVGPAYTGFAYHRRDGVLAHAREAGGVFADINESGLIVGEYPAATTAGFMGRVSGSRIEVENLNDYLVPSAAGWTIQEAVAVNNHNFVLAKVHNAGDPARWAVLIPRTYLGGTGHQQVENGAGSPGGCTVVFSNVTAAGSFDSTYTTNRDAAGWDALFDGFLEALHPSIATNLVLQGWDLEFTGTFEGEATICLDFDPDRLTGAESELGLLHYDPVTSNWTLTADVIIDPAADTLTFSTPGFSPFELTLADGAMHALSAESGANGQVTPSGDLLVPDGASPSFAVSADRLYRIGFIATNGADVPLALGNADTNRVYTWPGVHGGGTVTVSFVARETTNGVPLPWLDGYYPGSNAFDALSVSDTDGDGVAAWREYVLDTSPTNFSAAFGIRSLVQSGTVMTVVGSPASTARFYRIYARTNPAAPPNKLSTATSAGSNVIFTVSNAPAAVFYRLGVDLEP